MVEINWRYAIRRAFMHEKNGLCKMAFLQTISYVTKILFCGEVEGALGDVAAGAEVGKNLIYSL